jgi:hypothetical protein
MTVFTGESEQNSSLVLLKGDPKQASGIAGPGTKVTPVRRQSMTNLFDQTPEEPRPVWMPVPATFEEKPKPDDDGAGGYGLPPQIQNRPLRF